MNFDVEVKISLKKGMLSPEASTIEKALALLDYEVKNTQTLNIIKFTIDVENKEVASEQVDQMIMK